MRSPAELAARLRTQWRRPALRLARLTSASAWPLRLAIGRPPPARVDRDPETVRAHVRAWSAVTVGEVEWEDVRYRSTSVPVSVPVYWKIARPALWAEACADRAVREEYATLSRLCASTPADFHSIWIGSPHLWQTKSEPVLHQVVKLASALAPGCAEGRPLRALSLAGVDSKFYEQHRTLLVALLDARFDGAASTAGLEGFLGADPEGTHWVLLVDLDGELLPFAKQRVNTQELATVHDFPGTHLLVVENERCLHQLPTRLAGTLVVLGSGLDLAWLSNPVLQEKRVAYWGDLDTWGLRMLGLARAAYAGITSLLMDTATFDSYGPERAVKEPEKAGPPPDATLNPDEQALFQRLLQATKGRLEQEFLPAEISRAAILAWHSRNI